jgi:hypothetical protein
VTAPRVVVYGQQRPFRLACEVLLRASGVPARLASRQAELAKAIGEGGIAVILVSDDDHDAAVARMVADASRSRIPVLPQSNNETVPVFVGRVLAMLATLAMGGDAPA